MPLNLARSFLLLSLVAPATAPLPAQDSVAESPTTVVQPAPEKGKPRSYWHGLYGCWEVTGAGKDRPRALLWLGHDVSRGNSLYGKVEHLDAGGTSVSNDYLLDSLPTFESGRLQGRVGPASTMWDLTVGADGNTLSGTWGGEPTTWTRRVPTIASIEVTTSSAALAYWNLRNRWNEGKENVLVLRVRGERLPTVWTQVLDVECDDPAITKDRWKVLEDGSIELRLGLDSRVRPGRKGLTINGAPTSFDLTISDFQEPNATPLVVWMRRAGAELWVACDEPLRYGEEWRVRIMFPGETPKRDIIEVDLAALQSDGATSAGPRGSGGVVLAYRDLKSPSIFETRAITIMPTAAREAGR